VTPSADAPEAGDALTADDLRQLVALLGLVPIPEPLLPRVLAAVQTYRDSLRRFAESGLEVAEVVTAQPFRAGEPGGPR
jgi:hypothetical protein